MSTLKITRQFSFETAHALLNYDGLCRNIHGHSYTMYVTVKGEPIEDESSPKAGMIMDFGDLKQLVNETVVKKMDHALVLNDKSDPALIENLKRNYEKVITVPFQPTTEHFLVHFAKLLQEKLPQGVTLYAIRLSETASSYAEWCVE